MVTPHINKWDYWNYKIRETGTGTEYYFNANNKAGGTPDKVYNTNTWLHISQEGKYTVSTNSSVILCVTPDEFTKDGTAYYETIIQPVGYGSYGIGINWAEPGV